MKTYRFFAGIMALMLFSPMLSVAAGTRVPETPPGDLHNLKQIALDEQADLAQRGLLVNNLKLNHYLAAVAGNLWAHAKSSLSPVQVRVLANPKPDAYMYPNGVCYLHTGLLVRLENEDQLAMAIAHEMVHYIRQHTLKAYYMFHPGADTHRPEGIIRPAKSSSRNHPSPIEMLKSAELQADREGLQLIMAAGYRPAEALKLIALLDKAVKNKKEAVQKNPALKKLLAQRAKALEKAIARSSRQVPEMKTKVRSDDFEEAISPALMANARSASLTGDLQTAELSIGRYLRICPNEPGAHYLKGEIFRKKPAGSHDVQALEAFHQAIALNEKYAPAYREIGLMHFKSGHTQKARNYLQAYVDLEPDAVEKKYIDTYLKLCTQ